jgi:flagellar basal-body rod protein FlgF
MEATTYVALSAQMALEKELGVVANNVANASTAGFKADRQLFQSYVSDLKVPGRSIAFVQDRATYIDRQPGAIEQTGNPLDVAVQGSGYLSVRTPQGVQYSRDGRLQKGPDGTLIDSAGRTVLDPNGAALQLPDQYTDLQILGDGTVNVRVAGAWRSVGQIALSEPADAQAMRKAGDGLLTAATGGMRPVDPDAHTTRLVQGAIEGSTVQPVKEIANMTELSRSYERLQTMLSDDNDREQKMIQTLGTPL